MPRLQRGVTLLAPRPRARGDPRVWEQNSVSAHQSLDAGYIQSTPRMAPACADPRLCGIGGVRAWSPGLGRFSEAGTRGWSQGCSHAGRAGQSRGSSSILTRNVLAHLDQRNPSSVRGAGQGEQWKVSGGSTDTEAGLGWDVGMPSSSGQPWHLPCQGVRASCKSILTLP